MASDLTDILKKIYDDLAESRASDFHEQLDTLLTSSAALQELTREMDLVGKFLPADTPIVPPGLLLAAFHYTSGRLGRWFRVLLSPPNKEELAKRLDLSPLELYQHEQMYNEVSRDINIPIWPELLKPVVIQFGGEHEDTHLNLTCAYIHVPQSVANSLKEYFNNKHEAKRFYRLVLGYDQWSETEERTLKPILIGSQEAVRQLFDIRNPPGPPHPMSEVQKQHIFLALCFSFFLSIRNKSIAGYGKVFALVLPVHEGGSLPDDIVQDRIPVCGALVGNYSSQPTDQLIESLRSITLHIVRVLGAMESRVIREGQSYEGISVHEEDVLRRCAIIEERTQDTANEYRRRLAKLLNAAPTDWMKYKELDEFNKMTGADRRFESILHRIEVNAKAGYAGNESNPDKRLKASQSLFLHSEPGCGKEDLASLYNILGPRYLRYDSAANRHTRGVLYTRFCDLSDAGVEKENLKRNYGFQDEYLAKWEQVHADKTCPDTEKPAKFSEECIDVARINYDFINCGMITPESFDQLLCGSRNKPGVLVKQHYLCGTVFLDEFSTIDFTVANKLLKILAEPYQVTVTDGTGNFESMKVNLQIVFGSNRSPEQLIADGMNPAVVFRIAENSIRIPPLRERKADIALFVNKHLLKRVQDASDQQPCLKRIRRISLDGLRLICELRWPDNYRGLRGLLNNILEDREMRSVKDFEITFDDVIRAVSRKEAMGRASIPQKSSRIVLTQE